MKMCVVDAVRDSIHVTVLCRNRESTIFNSTPADSVAGRSEGEYMMAALLLARVLFSIGSFILYACFLLLLRVFAITRPVIIIARAF